MYKVLLVFGTRPELIKLAPLIQEFAERDLRDLLYIVNSAQHDELIRDELTAFGIQPDYQFTLERNCTDLNKLLALLSGEFNAMKTYLAHNRIHIHAVIAQGDTSTTFATALFAFYNKLPFIHIEAGLRTYDQSEPFPEEFHRRTITTIAELHFAPTGSAENSLVNEGVNPERILVTGNTVIDNLRRHSLLQERDTVRNLVLITVHRRENREKGTTALLGQITDLVAKNPDKEFLWILHPGMFIPDPGIPNLSVVRAIPFAEMMKLYQRTALILTDSGGIQEEAAYLKIPVLVFRSKTERVEGIERGIAAYYHEADKDLDQCVASLGANFQGDAHTIYGDGFAARKIADKVIEKYCVEKCRTDAQPLT